MKNKIIIICFLFVISNLFSSNDGLFQNAVNSQLYRSFLSKDDMIEDFFYKNDLTKQNDDWNFAVYPFSKFQNTLKDYFSINRKRSSFLYYRNEESQRNEFLSINVQGGFDYAAKDDQSFYFVHKGLRINSEFDNKLKFWGSWWAGHFKGDLDYARNSFLIDSFHKNEEDVIYLDNLKGEISYSSKYGKFMLGRNTNELGSNITGSIILSDQTNDYGYFAYDLKLGAFDLNFLHGTLIPDSTNAEIGLDNMHYKEYADKYLVLHKLGWQPSKNFYLFFGEEIIYGNRSYDFSYLLPHTFYRITEHNLQDRDNVMIFSGLEWKFRKGYDFYLNLIIDELRKKELFSDWWGNKYALQSGISVNFLDKNKTVFEVTAVRPWLYTHKYLTNKFSHDKRPLGYPSGSNLVSLSNEINLYLTDWMKIDTKTSYTFQGSTGNDFSLNYSVIEDTDETEVMWLEGELTEYLRNETTLTIDLYEHHKIKVNFNSRMGTEESYGELNISYFTFY